MSEEPSQPMPPAQPSGPTPQRFEDGSKLEQQVYETAYNAARHMVMAGHLESENQGLDAANQVLKSRVEELGKLTELDAKTGLLTHVAFEEKATQKMDNNEIRRRTDLESQYSTFVLFDLDDFKKRNEDEGYDAVDAKYLIPTAQILKRRVRADTDLVGKFGGEEFEILLDGVDESTAVKIVDKIRTEVNALGIGISAGIVTFDHDEKFKEVFNLANNALLEGKKLEGKNQNSFPEEKLDKRP